MAGRAEMDRISPLYLLLAGGRSRRMGGGDKNLLDLAGKPLMAHVIERSVPQGMPAVINANGDAGRLPVSAFLSSPMWWTALPGRWPVC